VSFSTYAEFKVAFQQRFGHNASDVARYQQDFFHIRQARKESVGAYYTRYLQLLAEMKAIGKPVDTDDQVAKFIDGLFPALRTEISRIHRRSPTLTLDELVSDAEMEEKALALHKPTHLPSINTVDGKPWKSRGGESQRQRCFFCRSTEHDGKDCPKIKAKKDNGTWEDRPRKAAGHR
jgi:hypothetical protein